MKRLLFLPLLLIASCSEEPSLLDRCIEANIEEVNFENKFLNSRPEAIKLMRKYSDAFESSNGTDYQNELDAYLEFKKKFEESLTSTEMGLYELLAEEGSELETAEQQLELVKSIQAKALKDANNKAIKFCNLQGIY